MSAVNEDTYVDDIITGKDEESDAIDLVKGVSETLLKGGFKLAPWTINSREVLQKLPHEFRRQENISLFPEQQVEQALGVFWISSIDCWLIEERELMCLAQSELSCLRWCQSTILLAFFLVGC